VRHPNEQIHHQHPDEDDGEPETVGLAGNIRELENFLERSVILSHGSVLQSPLKELEAPASVGATRPWKQSNANTLSARSS